MYTLESPPRDARTFDRHESDAVWERMQEQALRAFRNGKTAAAMSGWAKALDLANCHFQRGDPRLAASLTNQAFSLLRRQQIYQAQRLFDQATRCWEESWRWVPLMVPQRIAGETDDCRYHETAEKEFYGLIKYGQSITETLAREQCLPTGGLEHWIEHKPKSMCDLRKLISAVFLIASQKP